ncbi:PREDICTED: dual serine/threonine and tyrosine protein kinase-like isoform X2 [Nicrophorus vespilloides]|uniref:Dual serine/threonine and tyrosine protein kinase n=1 Tax=Nicrophorus vespilloides TaxID=110193 RepID=A0ABM1N8B6_NICVS|nr:PREDICTED: dual serine/threonine and tyrosine protein kinase-like isoform X2 [Nicrophorus vespilloides]
MLEEMPIEFRNYSKNCDSLKRVLSDTQNSLDDIKNNHIFSREIKEQLLSPRLVDSLRGILDASPAMLVLGQNCHSKALFVNAILEQMILPQFSSKWRWIKIFHGIHKSIRLTLGHEYEIVEELKANECKWNMIPEEDLQRTETESHLEHCPTIEIELPHPFLKENVSIIVPPESPIEDFKDVLSKNMDHHFPILIYAVSNDILSDNHIQEIKIINEKYAELPIIFVSVSAEDSKSTESLTESEQHLQELQCERLRRLSNLKNQLKRLGYLGENRKHFCSECSLDNSLISDCNINELLVPFIHELLKSNLLKMSGILSEIHNSYLRVFILSAFDMAREIQITPRRIIYAQEIELKLYDTLMKIASENQEEITKIIQYTLQNMRRNVPEVLIGYQYKCEEGQRSVKFATMEIHQLVLRRLSNSVANRLVKSVACLQESFIGTLQRCLESLEKTCQDLEGNLLASDAVKQILSAAYNIDLKSSTKFTVVHTFIDKLFKLVQNFQLPWSNCAQPKFDLEWQTQVVLDLLDSLSALKLAKTISVQFQEHIKASHESFRSAIRSLENQLSGKLEQTEEQRIAIRKKYAPRFARIALESTSLCDLIKYGLPVTMKEIGRGQFGVVFSCEAWGNVNPCAVKSVVPPDDRHWNDLAMEFYYTRSIHEHPRIVKLRGSVIDMSYASGSSVLLVMERMTRDLYCGLRNGLSWVKRIQIAIDVVEGIRYLHSQGLVHRDIKLKNVLLDTEDRAKLTDFGFCIPEAMMSGSIVGTPVHMAPELLSGHYDSSVDVYAFGILFWYICAGQVKLPNQFEQFLNKEQLWRSVRKGIRPECLPNFTQACWNLMEQCWAAEPTDRPLLGDVQPLLETIQENSLEMPDS